MIELIIGIVGFILIAALGLGLTDHSFELGGILGKLLGEKEDKKPKIEVETEFEVTDIEAKERPDERVTDEDLDYLE